MRAGHGSDAHRHRARTRGSQETFRKGGGRSRSEHEGGRDHPPLRRLRPACSGRHGDSMYPADGQLAGGRVLVELVVLPPQEGGGCCAFYEGPDVRASHSPVRQETRSLPLPALHSRRRHREGEEEHSSAGGRGERRAATQRWEHADGNAREPVLLRRL